MRTGILVILAMAGAAILAQPAQAQVRFGPQIVWGDDTDLGVGGRIDFPLGGALGVEEGPFANLFGSATASYFFPDGCDGGFGATDYDCSYIEFNGNLAVPFMLEGGSVEPYAGAGLHVARFSYDVDSPGVDFDDSDTDIGLNILGGLLFPISDLDGFVEGKLGLAGAEQFVLSAGILF